MKVLLNDRSRGDTLFLFLTRFTGRFRVRFAWFFVLIINGISFNRVHQLFGIALLLLQEAETEVVGQLFCEIMLLLMVLGNTFAGR